MDITTLMVAIVNLVINGCDKRLADLRPEYKEYKEFSGYEYDAEGSYGPVYNGSVIGNNQEVVDLFDAALKSAIEQGLLVICKSENNVNFVCPPPHAMAIVNVVDYSSAVNDLSAEPKSKNFGVFELNLVQIEEEKKYYTK